MTYTEALQNTRSRNAQLSGFAGFTDISEPTKMSNLAGLLAYISWSFTTGLHQLALQQAFCGTHEANATCVEAPANTFRKLSNLLVLQA